MYVLWSIIVIFNIISFNIYFFNIQIKELEHELEEVRNAAEKYEEEISGASQDENVELMDSQV